MELQVDHEKKIRAVCFSKDRYPIFKELNDSSSSGCMIKRFTKSDEDVMIDDQSTISKIDLSFDKCTTVTVNPIRKIINEFRLYDKVNIKAFITDLSPAENTESNGRMLPMQTGYVHDESGTCPITIFGECCGKVENNKSYLFTQLNLSRFRSTRLLKSTEITKIEVITMDEIDLQNRINTKSTEVACQIVSVQLDTLREKILCPDCKSEILIKAGLGTCDTCTSLHAESVCIKESNVKFVILTKKNEKIHLTSQLVFLKNLSDQGIDNKKQFAASLTKLQLLICYDTERNTVTSVKVQS